MDVHLIKNESNKLICEKTMKRRGENDIRVEKTTKEKGNATKKIRIN